MTDASVIDLSNKSNPPADDPDTAPYGWKWDADKQEWYAKRSAGGRKSGTAWFGKNAEPAGPDVDTTSAERDEGTAKADHDPEPAHMTSKPKVPPRRVPKKVKDDMSAAVGMIMAFTGPTLMAKDPYCGTAVVENAQQITDAVIPLLCRSSTVVAFFSDTSDNGWMLWFNLAVALGPVTMAVGRHHIMKTVELQINEETGDVYAVPRDMSEYTS